MICCPSPLQDKWINKVINMQFSYTLICTYIIHISGYISELVLPNKPGISSDPRSVVCCCSWVLNSWTNDVSLERPVWGSWLPSSETPCPKMLGLQYRWHPLNLFLKQSLLICLIKFFIHFNTQSKCHLIWTILTVVLFHCLGGFTTLNFIHVYF